MSSCVGGGQLQQLESLKREVKTCDGEDQNSLRVGYTSSRWHALMMALHMLAVFIVRPLLIIQVEAMGPKQ
jgi:hypothetical protein